MTTLGALLADAGLPAPEPADAAGAARLDRRARLEAVLARVRVRVHAGHHVQRRRVRRRRGPARRDLRRRGAPVPAAPAMRSRPARPAARRARGAVELDRRAPVDARLAMAGVTGTNGKTTVTWLLNGILANVGYASATIGTLTGQRTTPSAPELQRALRDVADRADARGPTGRGGARGVQPRARPGSRRRHPLRRRRVHEPEPRAPRLPRHDGALLRREGRPLRAARGPRRPSSASTTSGVGRSAARRAVPTVEVSSDEAVIEDAEIGRTSFRWRSQSTTTRLTGRVNVTNAHARARGRRRRSASTSRTRRSR